MTTWYRDGVVSLTNGSKVVTGLGTEWVQNVLPGGIFYTPTLQYEVERVLADGSLEFVKSYAGPTASNVEYAIAPTQGYIVSLAKQFGLVLDTYGALKEAWDTGLLDPSVLALQDGSEKVGFNVGTDVAYARPSQKKMSERKTLFDRTPPAEHAALRAKVSTFDCASSLQKAIAMCIADGGDVLHLPAGIFPYKPIAGGQDLSIVLQGAGRGKTIIKVIGDGVVFNRLAQSELRGLTIDLQGSLYTGTGCVFNAGSFGARDDGIEIKSANAATGWCVDFRANGGTGFVSTGSTYYTLATPGTRAAVVVSGTDTGATSRHFSNAESGGCTLYDFGGCNDFYITGGYTNGLLFSAATSKALLTNVRVGAAAGTVTIKGGSNKLGNCIFAGPVILEGSNHKFDCEVPGFDITDNSTGSQVEIKTRTYPCVWTASGTAPSLGNGTLKSFYDRTGTRTTVTIDLTLGSSTTVGSGVWGFSLPKLDNASIVQAGFGGFTQCGLGANFQFVCRASPGGQKVELFYVDGSGVLRNIAANSRAWAQGDTIRFTYSFTS